MTVKSVCEKYQDCTEKNDLLASVSGNGVKYFTRQYDDTFKMRWHLMTNLQLLNLMVKECRQVVKELRRMSCRY